MRVWIGGVCSPDGCIYGIPLKAENVLRVRCDTGEVSTVGGPFPGHNKWEGGVVADDGALYCMPLKAHYVMKIVPSDEKAVARVRRARQVAQGRPGRERREANRRRAPHHARPRSKSRPQHALDFDI